MSPRQLLITLALVFVAAGLVFGLKTTHANPGAIGSASVPCGSALHPNYSKAKSADYVDDLSGTLEGSTSDSSSPSSLSECHSAVSDARPIPLILLGLGALSLIISFVASGARPTNPDDSEKPSVWR